LDRALSLAQPEGYVRTFLEEREPMARLLRHAGSQGIAPSYVSHLLSAFPETPGATPPSAQPLIEPLSERELQVLRLLSAGKSNQEIADRLVLATGTVKRHLYNIYGKLNVSSRTQCAARARELGLL
jgi:LuxR family maltose regulon positive regulatory protein